MKIIILILLSIYSNFVFSLDVYNEQRSNITTAWVNNESVITINNIKVRQPRVDARKCTDNYCLFKGVLDDNNLNIGQNLVSFNVVKTGCSGETKVIHNVYNHYAINKDNKRINFFENLKRDGKCPAKFNQSTKVNLSLEQIDYQLFLNVNNAISAQYKNLNDFKTNYQNTDSQMAIENDRLDALEKSINECYQKASNATDISSLGGQFSQCENFKKAYDELNELIKTKELVSEEARNSFNEGLKAFGNTISDYKHQGKSVISQSKVNEIENSILAQMPVLKELKDKRVNFIAKFASSISERLENLYSEGKRDEFIMLAEYAEEKLNDFSTEIAGKNYPYAETQTLSNATKEINKTLEKYVDKNFWFNDANIPESTKDAIDNVLSKIDKKASIELKAALQKSNKIKAAAIKKGINDALSFFNTLDSVKTNSSAAKIDSFMSKAANQLVTFIKNDGLCLGARMALNDAADLFEFVSGRDFCNVDRELTISERAFSGLGLLIGSGELWNKVADKSSGVIAEAATSMSNFFKKTTKAGLKTEEEIIEYAQVIRSSQDEAHMARSLFDTASEEAQTLNRFNPINKGILHDVEIAGVEEGTKVLVADTFRSSSYFKVAMDEELILYRAQTKISKGVEPRLGHFWTRTKPGTNLSSKIDLALVSEWKNSANEIVTIKIPKNTKLDIFEGIAGEQVTKSEKLLGGGSQVYINVESVEILKDFIVR